MDELEWDENKRLLNVAKHGLDFIDSAIIFGDSSRLEFNLIKNCESRIKAIGKIKDKIFTVVYTIRNHKKRIISLRRASKHERKLYEKS